MRLWKAHGLGNDYLVWEGERNSLSANFVQKICHRHCGVGGDGILEPVLTDRADYGVRIWNPDGSVAEKSGNGLRIFAWWLYHYQNSSSQFSIDTGTDIVQCLVEAKQGMVTVDMGKAYFQPEKIPCLEPIWQRDWAIDNDRLELWAVGIGNPHCMAFFTPESNLDDLPWRKWGKQLEKDPIFPNRSNIQFAKVIDRHTIEIRIWERGAGETSASGSSSCAVAAAGFRMGWVDSPVEMSMPGGRLQVEISSDFYLRLRGPVVEIGRFLLL